MPVKRVIAEMGGKNAIIVDGDADLDQAVPGVLQSAFGYQGQKCSACSRVIVLDGMLRPVHGPAGGGGRGDPTGPPEDPACFMGPVIDAAARDRIAATSRSAEKEGRSLLRGRVARGAGYYVPPTVVDRPARRFPRSSRRKSSARCWRSSG